MKINRWLTIGAFLVSLSIFIMYNVKQAMNAEESGPVFEIEEDVIHVSVQDDQTVLLQGLTAVDSKDGDVTDTIVIESFSNFIGEHERYVNYAAFDSDNHVSKISRKIVYTDYTPIHFTLSAPLSFSSTSSAQDILRVVGATDCLDGDLSDNVNFAEGTKISMSQEAEYQVVFEVANSAGDIQQLPVSVSIYKATAQGMIPKIALKEYLVYTKIGKKLQPKNYLEKVTYQNLEYELTTGTGTFASAEHGISMEERENPTVSYNQFVIYDKVDYTTPGVYSIQYVLEDNASNKGVVNLVVVVEEE